MTVRLEHSTDLTLDAVRRVAWEGEPAELTAAALEAVGRRRTEFLDFVEAHGERHLYGITTRHHTGAAHLLDRAEREGYGRRFVTVPASTGPGLPDRVLRGVVLARLADVLNGTTTSDVLAWRRARDAGDALVATLAALAVVSAHTVALRGDEAPPGLAGLSSAVLARFPLDAAPADFGPALSGVQEHLVRGADRPGGEP